MSEPTITKESTVYSVDDAAHFSVTRSHFTDATGSEKTIHFASVKDGQPGAICIATHDGKMFLARHWRPTTRVSGWEFPRGMGERGETMEETALRELREETGLIADNATVLQTIHADTGMLRDRVAVAEIPVESVTPAAQSDDELSDGRWVSPEDFHAMIRDGVINDGLTLAAFCVWMNH